MYLCRRHLVKLHVSGFIKNWQLYEIKMYFLFIKKKEKRKMTLNG